MLYAKPGSADAKVKFFSSQGACHGRKVVATEAALELVALLQAKYGQQLMFHQSGGCCDNSAANSKPESTSSSSSM